MGHPRQGASDKVAGVATTVANEGKSTVVTYHKTQVVKFTDKTIKLNTGGYNTQTTMRRMNQAANEFELGYEVKKKAGVWTVYYGDDEVAFDNDTLTLRRS